MKKLFILLIFFSLAFELSAQQSKITSFRLENGMEVMLCEDHALPKICGAVCVHAGSKNDPPDNTGMAHYLEHMMFKGTDRIGTLDWSSEKVYLDSISLLYDRIHKETNTAVRNRILMKINELSNKAAQFAIPQEVDVILEKMGGENINAFTDNDVTVYHNKFPSNRLEQWLTVYSERFRHPVFRLFQTELEAVYEEYNMYSDNMLNVFMEDALHAAYGEHPYGRPIIGYPEHLKNPQLSAMQKFFDTYYHPWNMTLILVGDLDMENIRPLLDRTMGQLQNNVVDKTVRKADAEKNFCINSKIEPFHGRQVVSVRETPVKVDVLGYRTVGAGHQDALLLDILSGLFNNASGTGLLDELSNQNRVLAAQGFNYEMLEAGVFACLYVPKIIGQSHEEAENLVLNVINRVREGDFSDELFEAVKMEYLRSYVEGMEELQNKFYTVLELAMNGLEPEDFYRKEKIIRNLTKNDLIKIARKYFGDDYMVFRSDRGVKKFEKLQKPVWKPIVAKNTEASSKFAAMIEKMPVKDILPQKIDFSHDIQSLELADGCTLYVGKNPADDIFSMDIIYNYGKINEPALGYAVNYFSLQGTEKMPYKDFQLKLQEMGASMDVYCDNESMTISISGFDRDLSQILQFCSKKFSCPGNDEKMLATLVEERKSEIQTMRRDASSWGRALFDYARYGRNSPYLTAPSLKEVQKFSGRQLLDIFQRAFASRADIVFVGNVETEYLVKWIKNTQWIHPNAKKQEKPFLKLQTYTEPTIFLASNKKFVQSNLYFYNQGRMLDKKEWALNDVYNEYMSDMMYLEIRELRSLGYSVYGGSSCDRLGRIPSYVFGYLGTQADKTVEGCMEVSQRLSELPKNPDKFNSARTSLLQQRVTDYISFRELPGFVREMREQGFDYDPRSQINKQIATVSYDDLQAFFEKNLKSKNMVITIAGDRKRIDMKELQKMGRVVKLKYSDFVKE